MVSGTEEKALLRDGDGTPGAYRAKRPAPWSPRFTPERVVRFVLGAAAVAVGLWLLWYFAGLVLYLLVGFVLAYLLRPLVDRLQGLGLGRIASILVAFVLVLGAISILLTYLLPVVAGQATELSRLVSPETLTHAAASAEQWLGRVVPLPEGALVEGMRQAFQTLLQEDRITGMVSSVVDIFTNIFYAVIVIPFVTFFFLKDGNKIRHAILRLVPNRFFEVTLAVVEKVETHLGRYFRGLLLQCVSIALVAVVLLYVVGLDYALAVGLFAGLANTIPYFGPVMGFIAGTLAGVAQTGNFSLVPGVLVAMTLTQLADNLFFQPLIFSRAAQSHPLVILFVVLIGAQLAGILGMLLAIPVATIIRVTVAQVLWSLRNYRILKTA
jgi:predicted PurR-regulated permease PerM